MFSQRNPARTALLTAHWEPPEKLKDLLAQHGAGIISRSCAGRVRNVGDGSMEVRSAAESLSPLPLYRVDRGDPSFMKQGGR